MVQLLHAVQSVAYQQADMIRVHSPARVPWTSRHVCTTAEERQELPAVEPQEKVCPSFGACGCRQGTVCG
jgi:hypothetical protein